VADLSHEVNLATEASPVWKERETLTPDEVRALEGIFNLESLVEKKAADPEVTFSLPSLATDLYEEAFRPLGQSTRSYRNTNIIVVEGNLEYPEHHLVPRLMRELGVDISALWQETVADHKDVAKVVRLCRKIHEMVYIHPFLDGNGRVTRGLIHFALRRFGYYLPDWRVEGRDGYLDAVSEAKDNPQVFEQFLTKALTSSYKKVESQLMGDPYYVLTDKLAEVSQKRGQLEKFLNA